MHIKSNIDKNSQEEVHGDKIRRMDQVKEIRGFNKDMTIELKSEVKTGLIRQWWGIGLGRHSRLRDQHRQRSCSML